MNSFQLFLKIIIFFNLISLTCLAQNSKYQFSDLILKRLETDSVNTDYEQIAVELSFINDYKDILFTCPNKELNISKPTKADSIYFNTFIAESAPKYIIARAKKERIIIFNEAHYQPLHRVFVESLLDSLYNVGYRYFGVEALYPEDGLNKRKYPTQHSGYYTLQPQFGNLIRTALQLGYNLFPYESRSFDSKQRECDQALNIKKVLDKDSSAKIIIYCGYDHLVESEYKAWGKAMAGRLKEYTDIDPFTVDQVQLTEHPCGKNENAFFNMIYLKDYTVFIDTSGRAFNGKPGLNQYDIEVYHPRTEWSEGRPDWMFSKQRFPYYINDKITIGFPCLVYAYYENEDITQAVPTDVIELQNKKDKTAMSLAKGKYVFVIKNRQGKEQLFKIEL